MYYRQKKIIAKINFDAEAKLLDLFLHFLHLSKRFFHCFSLISNNFILANLRKKMKFDAAEIKVLFFQVQVQVYPLHQNLFQILKTKKYFHVLPKYRIEHKSRNIS